VLNIILALAVAILFCSVGIYHVLNKRRKSEELEYVMLSYGCSWIVIGVSYLCVAAGQLTFDLHHPLASQNFFYLTYIIPLSVIIPYYYFASYMIWGNRVLSRRLLILGVVLFVVGTGMVLSIPLVELKLSWIHTWDFASKAFNIYFFLVGSLPALVSLGAFMFYLYPESDSRLVRYRIAMISAAFFLVVMAWSILVVRTAPSMIISRVMSLTAGVLAQVAYFPPVLILKHLEQPPDDSRLGKRPDGKQ
jgi:hypothetical protein